MVGASIEKGKNVDKTNRLNLISSSSADPLRVYSEKDLPICGTIPSEELGEGEPSDIGADQARIVCLSETVNNPQSRAKQCSDDDSSYGRRWSPMLVTATVLAFGASCALSRSLFSPDDCQRHALAINSCGDASDQLHQSTKEINNFSIHGWTTRQTEEDEDKEEEEDDEENKDEDENNDEEKEDEENKDEDNEEEEDDDRDGEEENDEDGQEENNDENENNNQQGQNQQDYGGDGFFDDDISDDLEIDNPARDDDFYAFYEGPDQPHLFPLDDREIIGYFIASAALTLGASGGIGGGGIVVPVYLLVMGMGPKVAIPIGAVTVLGGALSSTCINWHRRHPLADRPLIDWDFILVMQPVVLIGVSLGTFIHQLLSEQILIVLLVVLLSATAHSTLSKAMRMYEAEKRYIRHLKAALAEPPTVSPSRTFTWGDGELHTMKPTQQQVDDEEKERILIENPDFVTLRSDLIEEEKFTPNSKIMVVVCVISVLITLNVMVGGGGIESPWGIVCGSTAFWTIHAVMLGFLMVAAWSAQAYLIARHEIKNIVRFDYVHGDIRWNRRAGWLYPIVFMVAGLLAGMFGIGGGIMIVPLLLTIGTHPAVASSTSSAMVLITSLVSTSTYAVFGLILADYAVVGFFVAFFSSLVGQMLMGRLRQARSASGRAFERNSYIAFVIGGVVLISAVLMTIQYILSIVEGPDEDYGNLCNGLTFNT